MQGLATECENTSGDLQANDDQTFDSHRQALNMWSFLLGWATYLAENKAQSKQNQKETGEFTSRSGRVCGQYFDEDRFFGFAT